MADRIITLIIVFSIIGAIFAVFIAFAVVLNRRQARANAATRPKTRDRFWNDPLSDGTRMFYEGGELYEFREAQRRLRQLVGAALLSENWTTGDTDSVWDLRFAYCGYEFEIYMNDHGGCSAFSVNDPSCPGEELVKIAEHFDRCET